MNGIKVNAVIGIIHSQEILENNNIVHLKSEMLKKTLIEGKEILVVAVDKDKLGALSKQIELFLAS